MAKYPPRSFQDEGKGMIGLGTRIAYSIWSNIIGLTFCGVIIWILIHP